MLMLRVADRGVVRPRWDETRLVAPQDLQDAIDTLVAAVPAPARAFARPSGTEDAVRVYAEGPTQAVADDLALAVLGAVHRLAGGVGGIQRKI
jgi:phosphoacetylglucosamine mutase